MADLTELFAKCVLVCRVRSLRPRSLITWHLYPTPHRMAWNESPQLLFICKERGYSNWSDNSFGCVSYYYADMSSVTPEIRGWIEKARRLEQQERFHWAPGAYTATYHRCRSDCDPPPPDKTQTARDGFFQFRFGEPEFHDSLRNPPRRDNDYSPEYMRGRAVARSIFTKSGLQPNAVVHETIVAHLHTQE